VRKAAGLLFVLYCGLALIFVAVYTFALTAFDLPIGPPIVAVVSVLLACVAMTAQARRHG
jgi:uncharacterized membrane protein